MHTHTHTHINVYTLSCVKHIASGNLLYSTGSSAWCSVMTQGGRMRWVGRRLKREGIYVYVCICVYIYIYTYLYSIQLILFPLVSQVKNLPANTGDAGDEGSIPGSGKSPGGGNGNPLQYSCLENLMVRGTWWATVHGVAKSWTRLSDQAHTQLIYVFVQQKLTQCCKANILLPT